MNILGVCEARWINNGDFPSDEHRAIYTRGERKERKCGK